MAGVYLCAAVLSGVYGLVTAHSCQVSDIEVQPNFDITRMSGRWYEIKWSAHEFIPEEYRFRDYEHWYIYNGNTRGLDIKGHGRFPEDQSCFYYNGSLIRTSTPGKLLYTRPDNVLGNEGTVTTPYWIISTDYKNYALTYGCTTENSNGTCDPSAVESWVWSRKPWLSPADTQKIDDVIRRVCVDPDSYLSTPHRTECPTISDATRFHVTGYISILVVAMATLWMQV